MTEPYYAHETIHVLATVQIAYKSGREASRRDALNVAVELHHYMSGVSPNGCYGARLLDATITDLDYSNVIRILTDERDEARREVERLRQATVPVLKGRG